jgi:uncharacterized damage-inducible protein DinB
MTQQDIKTLAAYNAWATDRIFEGLAALPAEETTRDLKSSHRSIHGTLAHLAGAEKMWLSRMLGTPDKAMITPEEVPTVNDVRGAWEKTGLELAKFLGTLSDRKLQETFAFPTAGGGTLTYRYSEALQHVFNHSTFHRGQVVTLMRQMGHTPPDTGLSKFIRETRR